MTGKKGTGARRARSGFSHPQLLRNRYIRGFLSHFPDQDWDLTVKVTLAPNVVRLWSCLVPHSLTPLCALAPVCVHLWDSMPFQARATVKHVHG